MHADVDSAEGTKARRSSRSSKTFEKVLDIRTFVSSWKGAGNHTNCIAVPKLYGCHLWTLQVLWNVCADLCNEIRRCCTRPTIQFEDLIFFLMFFSFRQDLVSVADLTQKTVVLCIRDKTDLDMNAQTLDVQLFESCSWMRCT